MENELKKLENDTDGMATYEYIANHIEDCDDRMDMLVANLNRVDTTGQFCASAARFLHAVDAERFSQWMSPLIEGVIVKDRERKYLGSLLEALWGADYHENAAQLQKVDNDFRRIYKRLFPSESLDNTCHFI